MFSRKKNLIAAAAIISITALGAVSSHAGKMHYRWLDDRGNPVHSDRPPPKGVDYEVITTGSGLKRVVSAEEGAVPADVNPRVGNEFDQVDSAADTGSKKNPELCDRARKNLEALSGSAKVKVRNDQGEERYLEDEEVFVEQEKAKAQISVYCP